MNETKREKEKNEKIGCVNFMQMLCCFIRLFCGLWLINYSTQFSQQARSIHAKRFGCSRYCCCCHLFSTNSSFSNSNWLFGCWSEHKRKAKNKERKRKPSSIPTIIIIVTVAGCCFSWWKICRRRFFLRFCSSLVLTVFNQKPFNDRILSWSQHHPSNQRHVNLSKWHQFLKKNFHIPRSKTRTRKWNKYNGNNRKIKKWIIN